MKDEEENTLRTLSGFISSLIPHPSSLRDISVLLKASLAVASILAAASYFHGVPENPPGFYIDESSIAYNAYTIAETGRDEYGERFPLFFRAFGEFKNPVYIYLLAAVFKITGPSIEAARSLSAALGVLTAVLLWVLALRVTGRKNVAHVVALSALLTPWLFENSRLVFEVALYPPLVALFLLALHRAADKDAWTLADALSLAATLALLTYAYSIGRLFAPLLAAGLALFITRQRLRGVVFTWLAYALALAPLVIFNLRNPDALMSRFWLLTYIKPESTLMENALNFVRQYLGNISLWRLAVTGEINVRDHVGGMGSVLAATLALACAGLFIVLRSRRREAFWRFILYALAVSVVPASLTTTEFPLIRLIAFPVILHVLLIPAALWLYGGASNFNTDENARGSRTSLRAGLSGRRVALCLLLFLMVMQGALFRFEFHREGPRRGYVFDEQFPREVLPTALAQGSTPIYLHDPLGKSGYIQGYWHGMLRGLDASRFIRSSPDAPPPHGAIVISTEEQCVDCRLLLKSINYIVYERTIDHRP